MHGYHYGYRDATERDLADAFGYIMTALYGVTYITLGLRFIERFIG